MARTSGSNDLGKQVFCLLLFGKFPFITTGEKRKLKPKHSDPIFLSYLLHLPLSPPPTPFCSQTSFSLVTRKWRGFSGSGWTHITMCYLQLSHWAEGHFGCWCPSPQPESKDCQTWPRVWPSLSFPQRSLSKNTGSSSIPQVHIPLGHWTKSATNQHLPLSSNIILANMPPLSNNPWSESLWTWPVHRSWLTADWFIDHQEVNE